MSAPRVRTIQKLRHNGWYRYKRCEIQVSRDSKHEDWYVIVRSADGRNLYDGWWDASADKTQREAVLEALYGSQLHPRPDGGATP